MTVFSDFKSGASFKYVRRNNLLILFEVMIRFIVTFDWLIEPNMYQVATRASCDIDPVKPSAVPSVTPRKSSPTKRVTEYEETCVLK